MYLTLRHQTHHFFDWASSKNSDDERCDEFSRTMNYCTCENKCIATWYYAVFPDKS